MYLALRILVLVLFTLALRAQEALPSLPDSLQSAWISLRQVEMDTVRFDGYKHLIYTLQEQGNFPWIVEVSTIGEQEARKTGDFYWQMEFLFFKAVSTDILGNFAEAVPMLESGYHQCLANDLNGRAADFALNLGSSFLYQGEQAPALFWFNKAMGMYKTTGESRKLSMALNNSAIIYKRQERHDEALNLYREALLIKQMEKDLVGEADVLQNIGVLHQALGQADSALWYLNQSYSLFGRADDRNGQALVAISLADLHNTLDEHARAIRYIRPAMEYFSALGSDQIPPLAAQVYAESLLGSGRIGPAKEQATFALFEARRRGQHHVARESLRQLARIAEQTGDMKEAYLMERQRADLVDSLTTSTRLALMEEMQARFDLERKEEDLQRSRLETARRTRERNLILSISLLAGILALVIIFLTIKQLRTNRRISQARQALHAQEMKQLAQQQEIRAVNALIEGQELERSRIARDLHDSLGGMLASIRSHLDALHDLPSVAEPLLAKTQSLVEQAGQDVRRIAHDMMPQALTMASFEEVLLDLAEQMKLDNLDCTLETDRLEELPKPMVSPLYRIILELLENVRKHAKANRVLIQLLVHRHAVQLLFEDDGQGFDPDQPTNNGLGLESLQHRVRILNGEWDLHSQPGQGTSITITIPLFSPDPEPERFPASGPLTENR